MKKFLGTMSVSVLLLSAGVAQAQSDSNVSLSLLGGWSSHPNLMLNGTRTTVDNGYNAGARLSYKLDDMMNLSGFSVDADYFYNQSDYARATGAQLRSSSFMGNLIYHLPTASPLSFYGGGGAGVVNDDLDGTLHGSSAVFGWQALGGTEYAFNSHTSMFAEYRYQNAHDANIGALHGVGNTSNNVSVGVKLAL